MTGAGAGAIASFRRAAFLAFLFALLACFLATDRRAGFLAVALRAFLAAFLRDFLAPFLAAFLADFLAPFFADFLVAFLAIEFLRWFCLSAAGILSCAPAATLHRTFVRDSLSRFASAQN